MLEEARSIVTSTIDGADSELHKINKALHENPELGYEEHFAHQTITSYLSSLGFNVKKHAYGFDTSFEAEYGSGGRLVIICAEYDALPGIGHSCGHNLIATSSIATFTAAVEAMKKHNIEGRLRILGTPAEEGGGGKAKLIEAGAFPKDTAAAIMAHPMSAHQIFYKPGYYQGLAGLKLIASHKFKTEFRGKPAHAAGEPWNGVNALDAAVSAYANVGLLRQQMEPDERVHGVIEAGGTVPNVITDYTRMNWNVRSPTIERAAKLLARVKNCIEAAALASGCKLEYISSPTYLNLRANKTLCELYAQEMDTLGTKIQINQEKMMNASTDMGNVSHIIPSFHGAFVIPAEKDVSAHHPAFAACAGTDEGHKAALNCAKGMAMLALRVLVDENVAKRTKEDFEQDDE
ncbi:metal-dependent amidase/aminoacylase/carboxypeptidase [Macroventuria anomochaeta]|uniref:Metal-dependent amidase/aminoacylase/carboxypeptidase n=1 Tax=Macroventuria anomochaeta TaxID=301207 RepID=A0ACB6RUW1_9PLEO|nr:metal-dependent amidase/aminoacylase/carboxypeptidase [Macroventuria anomochaeta]KAF2625502.1 metal-dependent amidase/aminoacylase/carboxypeptidase [Macroventuria anomochaeta]